MESDIFDILCGYFSYIRFDEYVINSNELSGLRDEVLKLQQELAEIGLTERQKAVVQNLLTANNELNEKGIEIVYKHAFLDCASLLQELGVLNNNLQWQKVENK